MQQNFLLDIHHIVPAQRACNFDTSAVRKVCNSRLCDRLRSSATIWKQLSLRSSAICALRSAIVCNRLRSSAIIWKPALILQSLIRLIVYFFILPYVHIFVFLTCRTGGLAGQRAKRDTRARIFFVSGFALVGALRARVSRFILCPANPPVLQATFSQLFIGSLFPSPHSFSLSVRCSSLIK